MKHLKSVLISVFLLILFIGISSCNNSEQGSNTQDNVKVGVILPLTGEMATYGEAVNRGIQIAVEEVKSDTLLGDKQLEVLIEDSKTETQAGISALQKLINIENVNLFIGDISSTITLAMIPVIEQNDAFLFSPGAATPKLSDISENFARNWPSSSQEASAAAEYSFNEMGHKEASIVYVNNDWGISLQEKFESEFQNLGGSIGNKYIYELGQTNFRTLIVRLNEDNSSMIYLAGNQKEMGNFIRQLREAGNDTPVVANTSFLEPDCLNLAGRHANGVIVPTPEYNPQDGSSDEKSLFYNQFKEKYPNMEPSRVDANGYDAIMLIVEAYNSVGSNPLDISNYIRNLNDYSGAAGNLSFNNGDVEVNTIFKKVVDGKPTTITNN